MKDKPLRLQNVELKFGDFIAISNLTLELDLKEFLVIVGPSGCGKSTLLSLMAGHQKPTSGSIEKRLNSRTVFQGDGLLPWLTVSQNIVFASETQNHKDPEQALQLIGMKKFADHFPHELSGGMKQRVEIARALQAQSPLILLDEPFSNLDYLTRKRMRLELKKIFRDQGISAVLVTHDIDEAVELADRILVLAGPPARVTDEIIVEKTEPAAAVVARILKSVGMEAT